ncbi:MAG: BtaA family protein [Cyanobacteria bacterium]|nr:BtaA family protein [Cyanobacteriota bacterium]
MRSEAAQNADFTGIRYAQCWEDADILIEALAIEPGDVCLSIASAGDNALSMLTQNPGKVVALDLSPAQLACLALRVAAYRTLSHSELLTLLGVNQDSSRSNLYQRCRSCLDDQAKHFWDKRPELILRGIGRVGKFEQYFEVFGQKIMPLIHSAKNTDRLFADVPLEIREQFYEKIWNNWRWQSLFRVFFSRFVMGRMGRDPQFFKYVQGSVSDKILARTRYAFTQLKPYENPYLQWILQGTYKTALPHALRAENFEVIRNNLDRLEWHAMPIEQYLQEAGPNSIHRYNLSDIFEYMSEENYHLLLEKLVDAGISGGRLAYWNMLVPRHRPESMASSLHPMTSLAESLFLKDKAFFYSAFIVEALS